MPYQQFGPSPIEQAFWEAAKHVIPELEREVWIGRYRVDFLIRSKKVIVELYGYQWHKSKDKLTRDAVRERFLQKSGYRVLRFTGTEVHKDPQGCAQEVVAFLRTIPDVATPVVPPPPARSRAGGNPEADRGQSRQEAELGPGGSQTAILMILLALVLAACAVGLTILALARMVLGP